MTHYQHQKLLPCPQSKHWRATPQKHPRIHASGMVALVVMVSLMIATAVSVRQHRLNADLIAAIGRDDMAGALALLDRGADPNTYDDTDFHWPTWIPWPSPHPRHSSSGLSALRLASIGDLVVPVHYVELWYLDGSYQELGWQDPQKWQDRQKLIDTLIKRGADVNRGNIPYDYLKPETRENDPNDYPPILYIAEYRGPLSFVRLVLQHGGRLNSTWQDYTPLTFAAAQQRCQAPVLQTLLECGADVNQVAPAGQTALMRATLAANVDKVAMLLQYHADVNIKSPTGETALDTAQRFDNNDEPAYGNDPRIVTIKRDLHRIVTLLKQAGDRK